MTTPPAQSATGSFFSRHSRMWLHLTICLLIALATVLSYLRLLHAGFINLDDPDYVVNHLEIHTAPTLSAICYAFHAVRVSTWQPLVFISFMLDWVMYGLQPGGYHLTNILLHIATALVLYFALYGMTGSIWKSGVVAALFALHPLHVESVAWISERKDTLSALFWVLTMLTYIYYTRLPSFRRYALVWLSFVAGLLSKSMVVTLPVVLLVIDYWPLGRFSSRLQEKSAQKRKVSKRVPTADLRRASFAYLVIEKLPLLVPAIVCGVVASILQGPTAIASLDSISLGQRISNAGIGYVSYIEKMLYPVRLSVLYPLSSNTPYLWEALSALLALLAISTAVLVYGKAKPYLRFGWLWYVITLLPVIGLVQVGAQSMADRYTYIPLIGLFVMITWGLPDAMTRLLSERFATLCCAFVSIAALCALMTVTCIQAGYWHDSVTLLQHSIQVTTQDTPLHENLGSALAAQGRLDEASRELQTAIRIQSKQPNSAWDTDVYAHHALAAVLRRQHRYTDALAEYRIMANLIPPSELSNWKDLQELTAEGFTEGVLAKMPLPEFSPNPDAGHLALAISYAQSHDYTNADEQCRKAIRISPRSSRAYLLLGIINKQLQHYDEAYLNLGKAIEYDPKCAQAYCLLAELDSMRHNSSAAAMHADLCSRYGGSLPPELATQLNLHKPIRK